MSRFVARQTGGVGGLELRIDAFIGEVVDAVGSVPPMMVGVVHERMFDLLNHHRLSVLKHSSQSFPGGGRQAQKFLAARLHRFGAKVRRPVSLDHLVGESFGVEGREDLLVNLERGGEIQSREPMVIPFGGSRFSDGRDAEPLRQALRVNKLKELGYRIINTPKAKGLVVLDVPGSKRGGRGARSVIVGVLRDRRRQRPLLGFMEQYQRILPKHSQKLERDMDAMLTEAGRTRLLTRLDAARARRAARGRAAGRGDYARELRRFFAKAPINDAATLEMYKRARRLSRSRSERGGGAA